MGLRMGAYFHPLKGIFIGASAPLTRYRKALAAPQTVGPMSVGRGVLDVLAGCAVGSAFGYVISFVVHHGWNGWTVLFCVAAVSIASLK